MSDQENINEQTFIYEFDIEGFDCNSVKWQAWFEGNRGNLEDK
ncbi:MAG: hypothetical protein ACI9E5_000508 [Candidatus Omnitrophota bacterium]